MNTLSIHRPLPSLLTAIPGPSSLPVHSGEVNWLPWSVLKICGRPPHCATAAARAFSRQRRVIVLLTAHPSTLRLCQSITAHRPACPCGIGIYVMSEHHTSPANSTKRSRSRYGYFRCLHRQLPDLGMQPLALPLKLFAHIPLPFLEGRSQTLQERSFPFRDLRGMNLIFPRNLLGGFLCFERFQPHPGFEGCVVFSAFGFHWPWSFRLWFSTPPSHRFFIA